MEEREIPSKYSCGARVYLDDGTYLECHRNPYHTGSHVDSEEDVRFGEN